LASYKRIGVGAVTPGERELALGATHLGALLRSANTRVVAANIVTADGKPAFDGSAIVDAEGISVGVFGIVEPPPEAAASLEGVGLAMTDGVEATRASVQSLRQRGVGLVVGLFHVAGGAARAEQIVGRTGDVDIVVLGHGSDDLAPRVSLVVGRTLIVYAGALGSNVGRIDVRSLDAGVPRFEDHSIALTRTIPDHLGVGLLPQIEPERARIAEEKAAAAERRKKGQKEPEVFESWTYASNAACALCHEAAIAYWKTTDHADAMATLKKKGHDSDPACIGCHMTGYLQPGGTRSIETARQQFADVGCECCHGPSALHVRSMDKKKGTSRKVEATVCFGCHTSDQNLGAFDYAAAVRSIVGPGHGAAPR
jgi:Cytochrome c554 and c-prime